MPRSMKKQVNYEEELMKIDMQITRWQNTILELKERKKELEEEQKKSELSALYDAVKASGRSISSFIEEISAEKQSIA